MIRHSSSQQGFVTPRTQWPEQSRHFEYDTNLKVHVVSKTPKQLRDEANSGVPERAYLVTWRC